MSAKLPSVYTPNKYRERMNREVREKFGDKTHHAFDPIHNVRDFNQDPNVRHYEDKYRAMSPYLKDRFENARGARGGARGVNVDAQPFKLMGGKKKRKMTQKRKKSRKSRKGKGTKRRRRRN